MIPPLLFAITLHEFAHARAALWRGDPTAYMAGRLTLNPASHLDMMGSIVFIVTMFSGFPIGWAKPVPVSFHNLRNPKQDMIIVAAAGPLANLALGIVSALLLRLLLMGPHVALMVPVAKMLALSLGINGVLLVFNLLPIYPLDGSRILTGFLPYPYAEQYERYAMYGPIVLIFLVATGVLGVVMRPVLNLIHGLLAIVAIGGYG